MQTHISANHSTHTIYLPETLEEQEIKLTMFLSSSDCEAWFAVFLIESVTIVTVNLLSIILFIRNSNIRSRGMYLIINLTVADVLVGGISTFHLLKMVHFYCNIVTLNLTEEGNVVTIFVSIFPSHFFVKHCCDFFRAAACHLSSIQASRD